MSWFDDLVNTTTGAIESLSESYSTVVGAQTAVNAETNAQPETNQQNEPVKGQNSDGSTIVMGGFLPSQISLTPQNLIIGGLVIGAVIYFVKGK